MSKSQATTIGRMLLYCGCGGVSVFLLILLFPRRTTEPIPPWKEAIAANKVIPLRSAQQRRQRLAPTTAPRRALLETAGVSPSVQSVPEFAVPTPPEVPVTGTSIETPEELPPAAAPQTEPAALISDTTAEMAPERTEEGANGASERKIESALPPVDEDRPPPLLDIEPPSPASIPLGASNSSSASEARGPETAGDMEHDESAAESRANQAKPAAQIIVEELARVSKEDSAVASVPIPEGPTTRTPAAQLAMPADAETLGEIIRRCRASYENIDGGYSAELVQEELGPEKTFGKRTLRIQAHRVSGRILLEWLDTVKQGRKISIDTAEDDSKLRIHLGPREPRLLGTRLTIDQNHFLIRSSTRYPISKVGIDNWIRMLEKIHGATEIGDDTLGKLALAGSVELEPGRKCFKIEQAADTQGGLSLLPPGGRRDWYIDAEQMLPILIIIVGPDGQTFERHELTNLEFRNDLTEEMLILE